MPTAVDFAVELAHDVRSPLGAIIAMTELLESGASGPVTPTQRRHLRLVLDAATSLSRLTTDIVETARIISADGREPASEFDIPDMLQTVQTLVSPMAEDAGLAVNMTTDAPRTWQGRRCAITRVLLNLMTNALKHTHRGFVECGARLASPGRVTFFVRDTGSGMQPSGAPVAVAAPGDWRSVSSGLGLGICKRLVTAMGSTLMLESRPGEGCCFSFDLAYE